MKLKFVLATLLGGLWACQSNCAHSPKTNNVCRAEPREIYQTPVLYCEEEEGTRICAYGHTIDLGAGKIACVFTIARKTCHAEWDLITGNCNPADKGDSL